MAGNVITNMESTDAASHGSQATTKNYVDSINLFTSNSIINSVSQEYLKLSEGGIVAGKIKAEQTIDGDTDNTLTTKKYVDDAITNIISGESGVYINRNQIMNSNGALQFNVMQCNRATITSGVESVTINNFPNITTNTLIIITPQSPHSEGFYQFWVEPETGSFTVNIEPASTDPWTFNFFISRY